MNSAWLTWSAVPCLALSLLACQRDNPAFDPDVGGADGGSEDNGETSTTQTSTTQTGDGDDDTGDGDGDTGDGDGEAGDGDGDGDATADGPDTGMEDPGVLDMAVAECLIETHVGLWPRFGNPMQFDGGVCPAEIGTYVRVVGAAGGNWLASPCPNGCNQFCNVQLQHVVGADGLQVGLATLIPPVNFDPNMEWVGCYYVEAVALTKETDDACVYSSLSVHSDEGPGSMMLFNANRESWGLTPSAAGHYGDWAPELEDTQMTCECVGLDIPCCPNSTVVAKQFVLGDPVPPGEVGGIFLNQVPYTFYAAQAQGGTNCEIDPETSWALWLEQ
jgi:hypothetical protein